MPAIDTTNAALVRIRNLSFSHGALAILRGVNADVARHRVTSILGPTGCGKSTLLRLIVGQYRPASGTVEFDGIDVHKLSRRALFDLRQRMGMQAQASGLLTDLTVYENVAFPLREHTRLNETMIRDIVIMKLEAVGLRGAKDLNPDQLSGGMQRRVALARAIAMDPELVILDEPFAGLDPITLGVSMRLIRSVNDALGTTTIVVSHSVEEALAVSDYAYVLDAGTVQDRGTPEEIQASQSDRVQQFLTGAERGPVSFHFPAPSMREDFIER